ncbi:MAG: ferrous iron transport protein A [Spirochaetes bacterium]|nr:ferrous iron transport protein A [Spirochaetota bacterium]
MKPPKQSATEIPLSELPLGQTGVVTRLELPGDVLSKLVEMGLAKGRRLTFVQKVPLGDPMVIELMGYRLALRHREARGIWVREAALAAGGKGRQKPRKNSRAGKAA